MKTSITKLTGGILAAGFILTSHASAVAINGGISFEGDYTSNNPDNLATSTLITFGPVSTTSTTGDFNTFIGNGVGVTTPVGLAINPIGLPASPIWSVGGFSLTLTSLVQQTTLPNILVLIGNGNITGPGPFTATPGEWIATFQRSGEGTLSTFSFSASSSATPGRVPDGGASLALLGVGILGLGGARRLLKK